MTVPPSRCSITNARGDLRYWRLSKAETILYIKQYLDALHGVRSHIAGEELIAENSQALLKRQLEPISARKINNRVNDGMRRGEGHEGKGNLNTVRGNLRQRSERKKKENRKKKHEKGGEKGEKKEKQKTKKKRKKYGFLLARDPVARPVVEVLVPDDTLDALVVRIRRRLCQYSKPQNKHLSILYWAEGTQSVWAGRELIHFFLRSDWMMT